MCNKEYELALTLFFRAIKAHLPSDIEYLASHVMTDDAGQYYNVWVAVFGTSFKLLCTWHVERAWQQALLQELNEDDFWQCLNAFIQFLHLISPSFAAYVQAYCECASEWVYCFHRGTLANTNMYVESFHNVLKSAYMERTANRRINSLLNILLKVVRNKAYERLIKVEKTKNGMKVQKISTSRACFEHTPPGNSWRMDNTFTVCEGPNVFCGSSYRHVLLPPELLSLWLLSSRVSVLVRGLRCAFNCMQAK